MQLEASPCLVHMIHDTSLSSSQHSLLLRRRELSSTPLNVGNQCSLHICHNTAKCKHMESSLVHMLILKIAYIYLRSCFRSNCVVWKNYVREVNIAVVLLPQNRQYHVYSALGCQQHPLSHKTP